MSSNEARLVRNTALTVLALVALRLVAAAGTPLTFDEAYYWMWSKHLAGGYYDHPPAAALGDQGGHVLGRAISRHARTLRLDVPVADAYNAVPGLGEIPVLGALFRGDSYTRQQQELVITVTPYLVNPVSNAGLLPQPDDGWTPPNDLQRLLLLRDSGTVAAGTSIPGDAGFMVQ